MTASDHLQRSARDHLMLHFTEMAGLGERELTIIERGDGCYVYDAHGPPFIDGLSGLFCVNVGHGFGDELGQAAHDQMRQLGYTSSWTQAHPRTIELAERIAALAPDGLDRVFFTSGRRRGQRRRLEDGAPVPPVTRRGPAHARRSPASSRTTGRRSDRCRSPG